MEPTPPGPRLVATVWANSDCTIRPSGEVDTVYLRVEMDIGPGNLNVSSGPGDGQQLEFFYSTDPVEYLLVLWVDFGSSVFAAPFRSGDVIECSTPSGIVVDNFTMDFYLPS